MGRKFEFHPEEKSRLIDAVRRFPGCRIMVLGDLMLDVFIWGDVNRISPEAPVPVVEVQEETRLLGGAANVLNNVAALGGKALVAGIVGSDAHGRDLVGLLGKLFIPTEGLVVEDGRPTTTKTRIIAAGQQVVRYDVERRIPMSAETRERVVSYLRKNLAEVDGLIISDYAKGLVTLELMEEIRAVMLDSSKPVIVDPKVRHVELYHGVTLITPNHHEASRMSGIEIRDEESLEEAADKLIDRIRCEMALITRGRDGMSLFRKGGSPLHIPTVARQVFDVTGAGDTVIATLALGMVAGLPVVEAALLANLAAGIVVGQVGTAAVSADDLVDAVENSAPYERSS